MKCIWLSSKSSDFDLLNAIDWGIFSLSSVYSRALPVCKPTQTKSWICKAKDTVHWGKKNNSWTHYNPGAYCLSNLKISSPTRPATSSNWDLVGGEVQFHEVSTYLAHGTHRWQHSCTGTEKSATIAWLLYCSLIILFICVAHAHTHSLTTFMMCLCGLNDYILMCCIAWLHSS